MLAASRASASNSSDRSTSRTHSGGIASSPSRAPEQRSGKRGDAVAIAVGVCAFQHSGRQVLGMPRNDEHGRRNRLMRCPTFEACQHLLRLGTVVCICNRSLGHPGGAGIMASRSLHHLLEDDLRGFPGQLQGNADRHRGTRGQRDRVLVRHS